MRNALKSFLPIVVMVWATAAIGDEILKPQLLTGDAAKQALGTVKAPAQFDLSSISVLRLVVEGKQMEVTSLGPAILSGKPTEAFTAGLFSQDKKSVMFIAKDSAGRVSELTLPVTSLMPKYVFHLFLAAADQPDREVEATVSSFLTKP
jgi:hypothetical protein